MMCVQIAYPFIYGMPPLNWLLRKLRPQQGVGVLVPSPLFRAIFFKLFVDMSQIPALNYLLSTGIRVAFSGDKSQWDRALQMPHYSPASMPAISWHTGIHFGQVQLQPTPMHWDLFSFCQVCRPLSSRSARCNVISQNNRTMCPRT